MAPSIWDPYRALNITTPCSKRMSCVGKAMSKGGSRCRWEIPGEYFVKIISILDEMGTKPPSEVSKLLPRLARLSLCEEYHQNQKHEMIEEWKEAIEAAAKEYEKVDKLRRKNKRLAEKLEKETDERQRLQELWESERNSEHGYHCDKCDELAADIIELGLELDAAQADSERHLKSSFEAEASRANLAKEVDGMIKSLSICRAESARLTKGLDRRDTELSHHRKSSEAYERTNQDYANASQLLKDLEDEAAKQYRIHLRNLKSLEKVEKLILTERLNSSELQKSADESKSKQALLSKQLEKLQSQLATECLNSSQLSKDLREAEIQEATLSKHVKELVSQLTIERETTKSLKIAAGKTQVAHEVLSLKMDSVRSELATKSQSIEHLRGEFNTTKAEEAILREELVAAQNTLESTLVDLNRSLKSKDELLAAAASREAATLAETSRMLEQIRQLEKKLSSTFWNLIREKIKTMANSVKPSSSGITERKRAVGKGRKV